MSCYYQSRRVEELLHKAFPVRVLDLALVPAPAVAAAVVVAEHTCGKFVSLLPNNNLVQLLFRKLGSKFVCLVFVDSVCSHHTNTDMLSDMCEWVGHVQEYPHLALMKS